MLSEHEFKSMQHTVKSLTETNHLSDFYTHKKHDLFNLIDTYTDYMNMSDINELLTLINTKMRVES